MISMKIYFDKNLWKQKRLLLRSKKDIAFIEFMLRPLDYAFEFLESVRISFE